MTQSSRTCQSIAPWRKGRSLLKVREMKRGDSTWRVHWALGSRLKAPCSLHSLEKDSAAWRGHWWCIHCSNTGETLEETGISERWDFQLCDGSRLMVISLWSSQQSVLSLTSRTSFGFSLMLLWWPWRGDLGSVICLEVLHGKNLDAQKCKDGNVRHVAARSHKHWADGRSLKISSLELNWDGSRKSRAQI